MSTAIADPNTTDHPVVSGQRWAAERTKLLAREKELMRLQDEVARERRALPWERLRDDYAFDTLDGKRTLAELFEGRRQLLVQHFMFAPGWEEGCRSCSYMADHTDGMRVHLANRDITMVAISRAPLPDIERFRRRMGWQFNWVSSFGTDFNVDFAVSFPQDGLADDRPNYNYATTVFRGEEAPGISVFYRDDAGEAFHTYSTFGRGVEVMMGAYRLMDLTPEGRGERGVPHKMEWVRHHDRYEPAPVAAAAGSCCGRHA